MSANNNFWTTVKDYAVPYYRHTYHSKFSAEEIRERLIGHIDTNKKPFIAKLFSSGQTENGTYQGSFEGQIFKIERIAVGKNSYRPKVLGVISNKINGSEIDVTMKLGIFKMIWMPVWAIIYFYISFFDGNQFNMPGVSSYFVLAVFFAIYLIVTISFNYEASKTKRFLKKIFEPIEAKNDNDWIVRN